MMDENVRKLTSFPTLQQDNDVVACLENVLNGNAGAEQKGAEMMEGVEYTSRPPSPPSSGATTPTLRIAPCPLRLSPLIPPPNYGAIKEGTVFRSAYPQDRNMAFLKALDVRSVLCLVGTQPSEAYSQWIARMSIKRLRVDIAPNKEGKIKTTWDSLCEALLIIMDCSNYPMYLHCNQGRHRTGCVVACLRKIQRWHIDDIIDEYRAYASPKAREGDIDLIRAFDPEAVFDYAKSRGYLDDQPFMKRMDSAIGDIDALAEALSSKEASYEMCDIDISGASTASTFSDDGIEMRMSSIDPSLQNGSQARRPAAEGAITVLDATFDQAPDVTGITTAEVITGVDEGALQDDTDTTTTVVELADEDIMSPPAVVVSNPLS